MLRLSTKEDIEDIISVWEESFGDTKKDIRFFLDAHYIPENTLVYECDGNVVSVLFLLDGAMHINGTDYSSYYLYAACTLKKYRGRGIMNQLLGFAQKVTHERNKFFIALKPGEDSLYGYYSKFGYKALFTKKVSKITSEKFSDNFSTSVNNQDKDLTDLRNNAFNNINYFKWDKNAVDFACEHHKYYGGEIFSSHKGYSLYTKNDMAIDVKETTFTTVPEIIDSVNQSHDNLLTKKIVIESPFNFEYDSSSCEIINSGMLLPVNEEAVNLIKTINNAYLALTLD